jgi:hypothetical protein
MSCQRDFPERDGEEVCRAVGDRRAFSNPNPIPVEHSASNNPEAPPPPPPAVDLATVLDRQNRILEFLANVVMNQNNNGQGNIQHGSIPHIHQISNFHRLRPQKFGGSDNPIEADDWLHEIEMKLDVVHTNDRDRVLLTVQQLVGPALAWWQSYKEVNPEARNMVWDDFVKLFREDHIPNSVMKLKRQEFMSLQQKN